MAGSYTGKPMINLSIILLILKLLSCTGAQAKSNPLVEDTASLTDLASLNNKNQANDQLASTLNAPDEHSTLDVSSLLDLVKSDEDKKRIEQEAEVLLREDALNNVDHFEDNEDGKELVGEKEEKPSFIRRVISTVQRIISPARSYYSLVQRYRNWYTKYNKLKAEVESSSDGQVRMRTSVDVMSNEYAKLDKKLMEQECNAQPENKMRQYEVENTDFILKILHLLIGELEILLTRIENSTRTEESLAELNCLAPAEKEADIEDQALLKVDSEGTESKTIEEEDLERAIKRAKRIAIGAASSTAVKESFRLIRLYVLNAIATHIVMANKNGAPDSPATYLTYLEPLVLLLGSPCTSLVLTYFRDLQFRAAYALVTHSVRVIRACPVPKLLGGGTDNKTIEQKKDYSE